VQNTFRFGREVRLPGSQGRKRVVGRGGIRGGQDTHSNKTCKTERAKTQAQAIDELAPRDQEVLGPKLAILTGFLDHKI
jgi:hypothetical protein